MKVVVGAVLLTIAQVCAADPTEQAIQRALIQRDQQSAEFAAQLQGRSLDALHAKQLLEPASQFHGYDRQSMAQEREAVLQLPPPVARKSGSDPDFLPLPGGPRPGVDPVTPQSLGQ
jgi:hypothetical protein